MTRKSFSVPILTVLTVIAFASCSNFSIDSLFSNVYKDAGLGQVSTDEIADAPAEDLIDQSGILAGQLSETFFEILKEDPTLETETLVKLDAFIAAAMEDPVTQAAVAQAAIALAVEINLNSVGADTIIDNAPAAIALLTSDGFDITNADDLKSFLDLLIPADVAKAVFTYDQLTTIEAIVNRLNHLTEYFDLLVTSLDLNGGLYMAGGLDAGTLAQIGLVVRILNEVEPQLPVEAPMLGASVVALLEAVTADDFNPNGFDPGVYIDISYLLDNYQTILEDPSLQTLLNAAGIDLKALMGQFGAV